MIVAGLDQVIVERLRDNETILKSRNNILTHLGCVSLRLFLGTSLIMNGKKFKRIQGLLFLFLLIITAFGYKFLTKSNTWKCYLRTVLAYIIAYILVSNGKIKEAGLIVITDALLSIQSRHTSSLFLE